VNCLEFRRTCLSDPNTETADYAAHRSECGECARFARTIQSVDVKLREAIEVPVPGDLVTRIKMRQLIDDEQHRRRVRPWQYALAASIMAGVMISAILGYRVYTTRQYVTGLEQAVLQHIKEEPQFLVTGPAPVPAARFQQVVAAFGGEVVRSVGSVEHAEICALRHNSEPIAHTVIKGEHGSVTVIYRHGNRVRDEVTFNEGHYHGMLIPAGHGNLAVVGAPGEPLSPLVQKLKSSIIWKL
jgi:Protein of unknown function (DUF3379)